MKQTLSTLKVVILALVLGLGISYVQAEWTGPSASPPTCVTGNPGCDAPVNVSATAQTKTGDFTAGGLTLSKYPSGGPNSFISPSGTGTKALHLTSGYAGFTDINNLWRWYVLENGNTRQSGTISIAGGSPAAGKVLTATNVNGDATWQTPTTVASGAPTFITPVLITTYTDIHNQWSTYNASSIIPTNAKTVIIQVDLQGGGGGSGTGTIGFNIRKDSASPVYKLGRTSMSQTYTSSSVQGFFPVSNEQTFDIFFYRVGQANMSYTHQAYIIGYM